MVARYPAIAKNYGRKKTASVGYGRPLVRCVQHLEEEGSGLADIGQSCFLLAGQSLQCWDSWL